MTQYELISLSFKLRSAKLVPYGLTTKGTMRHLNKLFSKKDLRLLDYMLDLIKNKSLE